MLIGQGLDVHSFDEAMDRPLRLAGITIPEGPALAGHSDADVVLHAVTDALLGAAALGDLGSLIGVDQAETLDADSSAFVTEAMQLLGEQRFSVVNVDVTVVAARPRVSQYRQDMRDRLAELLDIPIARVSLKATTTDHLGFIGRGEGIACLCVVLLTDVVG
ncbi:MAG: 2-C-methyl-D-erythritol 2,4-cyclodiphosphate synthase [Euzebya sp.]